MNVLCESFVTSFVITPDLKCVLVKCTPYRSSLNMSLSLLCSGVVKIALSRCIKPPSEICSEVVYDFEFIEDYVQPPPDPQPSHYPLSAPVSEETAADNSDFVPEIENRRRRNEFGPLMKKYIPLDHPISLLVFLCTFILLTQTIRQFSSGKITCRSKKDDTAFMHQVYICMIRSIHTHSYYFEPLYVIFISAV